MLDRLAELYVACGEEQQARMGKGVENFNTQVAADPFAVGESRSDGLRVAFTPLLTVSFHVDRTDRVVRVTKVSRYGN